jgi:hypothetical protein
LSCSRVTQQFGHLEPAPQGEEEGGPCECALDCWWHVEQKSYTV